MADQIDEVTGTLTLSCRLGGMIHPEGFFIPALAT